MRYLRYILVFALMVLGLAKVGAQNDRNFIRQGNRAYHKQKWLQPKRNIARLSPRTRRMRRLSIIWVAP